MEREHRLGQMGPNMKGNGVTVWLKDKVHFIMQMEMSIKVILLEIELMDMGFTSMLMGNDMKENGLMICKKVKVLKNLKMDQFTKVNLKMAKNGALEFINGQIKVFILVNGWTIILKVRVNTDGLMVEFT
jgi:hypothetical protein